MIALLLLAAGVAAIAAGSNAPAAIATPQTMHFIPPDATPFTGPANWHVPPAAPSAPAPQWPLGHADGGPFAFVSHHADDHLAMLRWLDASALPPMGLPPGRYVADVTLQVQGSDASAPGYGAQLIRHVFHFHVAANGKPVTSFARVERGVGWSVQPTPNGALLLRQQLPLGFFEGTVTTAWTVQPG